MAEEEAEVRELMLFAEELEAMEEDESVLRMKAGRGGLSAPRASSPSSLSCSSRRVVSASEDRRSCDALDAPETGA
jgi:hypothetical protein